MKNYRYIIPLTLIVMMGISWYMMISSTVSAENEYNTLLESARYFADRGVTKYAMENYNKILDMESSVEIYAEVAEYYKSQDKINDYVSWCKKFMEVYPAEKKSYEYMLDAYYSKKDYASCYDIIFAAEKRHISSDYIDNVYDEIEYIYKLDFNNYEDVGVYGNNFCAVLNDELWGYVDRYGEQKVACRYKTVGAYTQSAYSPVVNSSDEAYFIDKTGAKVLVADEKYKSFGLLIGGITAAEGMDGKYVYLNDKLEYIFGGYEFASSFNNGLAAVVSNGKWQIIDINGDKAINAEYGDVKLDEKSICFRNDRMFVMEQSSGYKLIDDSGKQVGSQIYEDARVFSGDSYAAVKLGGKWGFIDKDGKVIIEPTYQDARSFLNGLAAVKVGEKWGFIGEDGEIKIEPQFNDARDFNEKGSCFVNTGKTWQLLKLYRLNR